MTGDTILETRGLTKEFKGFVAVDGVNLKVRRGAIHALIGPNGAGKTTTFNLLTKFLAPTAGTILFNGEDITRARPADIARRGIIRSFQISAVFPNLTVLENVRIGAAARPRHELPLLEAREDAGSAQRARDGAARARAISAKFARIHAGELAYGRKRTLEIATTLAMEPELMLLDEPTAGMGHEDVDRVKELIKEVAAGRTVLMVEHNMSVVSGICDTITVMARGAVLAEGPYAEVSRNPAGDRGLHGLDRGAWPGHG